MSADWQHLSLREAGISLIDCVHKTPEAKEEGFPYVAIPQMKDGRIDLSSTRKISHKDFLAWTVKAKPEAYDIVISRRCNPGESACVPEGVEFALGQNLVLLRSDGKKVYKPYLRWLLNSPFWWAEVNKYMNVGAIFTSLKCADMPNFTLPIPSLDEQMKISEILYSLDNKIELNRQINQTLESMAQAIFKSWFVNFEPVKAKIAAIEAGEDAESVTCAAMRAISGKTDDELDKMKGEQPEDYAQLKSTAELFPSAMQDSELGEVPEGWKIVSLKELSKTISKGTTPSKKQVADAEGTLAIRFIKVKDIADDGQINRAGLGLIHESIHKGALKRSMLEENDLLFSIAGTIGRVSIVENDLHNSNTNQAVAFIRLNGQDHLSLALEHLKSKKIQESAMASVVQGVQANVSLTSVGNFQIVVPKEPILAMWNEVALSLHTEKIGRQKQNRELSQLCDTLLPKLLSGELEINAVNKAEI